MTNGKLVNITNRSIRFEFGLNPYICHGFEADSNDVTLVAGVAGPTGKVASCCSCCVLYRESFNPHFNPTDSNLPQKVSFTSICKKLKL